MPINVIFLAKIAINNHFHIVSNKIQSYHNFFLTFSAIIKSIFIKCNIKRAIKLVVKFAYDTHIII